MTETLFEYDHLLMHSEYRMPDIHSHLAVHLIIGLGAGLHCIVANENFDTDAVFVASDVPHTAYSDTGEMLVFLFDPASRYASETRRMYLTENRYFCLAIDQAKTVKTLWDKNHAELAKADKVILEYLGLLNSTERQIDERVSEVLTLLRETEEVPKNAVDFLCDKVFLSKSRLSHLFKENLGISLSRYLAWEKMRKGYILFQKYENITEAAVMAGFDSPSHFAATCKRMFGLSFSDYAKS